MNYNIVVGSTYWTLTGVNIFCANLVRSLNEAGASAHVLLTEQKTRLVTIYDPLMDFPDDVPIQYLPVQPKDSWGAHWGALIRYLEELAPCVYIPNADWRHSCVSSLLSDRVAIVGVVHSDDPMHYDHVQRLGDYWNAIVTVSKTVAEKTAAANPRWANKISTIPIGVSVPSAYPSRKQGEKRPLKIIYHGLLNQWQKRILDLPRILEELRSRNVPVHLTIAGGGNDEVRLRQELRKGDLLKMVEFLGVVPHSKMLKILESQDVFILTSEFEGMPNALLEAMGRGCVPVVTNVRSGIPELVKDGENGYLIPVGEIPVFADRLSALQQDNSLWSRLSLQAYKTLQGNSYNSTAMAAGYRAVFDGVMHEIDTRKFRRMRGVLVPPPAESGGFKIFPLEKLEKIDGVGSFPSMLDYEDFEREMVEVKKPKWKKKLSGLRNRLNRSFSQPALARDLQIVLSLPRKEFSIVRIFSETLVRELRKKGISAEILLTEQNTEIVHPSGIDMDFASDISVHQLPVSRTDGWGTHWGAMIRYLESKAPCIYIPNHDWRHSCVTPLLSKHVAVVAVAHGNDAPNHDQISRLGKYFNAVVAVSPEIERDIVNVNPLVAGSTVVIRYGIPVASKRQPRDRDDESPLKVVAIPNPAPGGNRTNELSSIVQALNNANVPVELTIAGVGLNPEVLMYELQPNRTVLIRIMESVQYPDMLALLDRQDVILWTDELCGLSNSIVDAMSRGCVPVAFQSPQEWIKDNWNGFVVARGDVEAIVERLSILQKDPDLVQKLSAAAYQTFSKDAFLPEDMTDEYIDLFQRVTQEAKKGIFKRPKGSIFPPPAEIDGIGILPTEYSYYGKWIGPFPAKNDYYDFKRQMQKLADRNLPRWLAKAKRRGREAAKIRFYAFRTWKRTLWKRSRDKSRLIRKKVRRHLSKIGL